MTSGPPQALAGLIFDYGRTLYDPATGDVLPDAAPTLAALAAMHRLAIVSLVGGDDYPGRRAARVALLRDRDLARHFAATDKDGLYRRALADLDLAATRVAIVDDRVCRGIARGNRHGATTIWFRNGRFRDELPDATTGQPTYTITTLAALPAVLGTTATAARGARERDRGTRRKQGAGAHDERRRPNGGDPG